MSRDIDEKLAEALVKVELHSIAVLARDGYYSDFGSPLPTPKMALIQGLGQAALDAYADPKRRSAIMELRLRVMEGEYDG